MMLKYSWLTIIVVIAAQLLILAQVLWSNTIKFLFKNRCKVDEVINKKFLRL